MSDEKDGCGLIILDCHDFKLCEINLPNMSLVTVTGAI